MTVKGISMTPMLDLVGTVFTSANMPTTKPTMTATGTNTYHPVNAINAALILVIMRHTNGIGESGYMLVA